MSGLSEHGEDKPLEVQEVEGMVCIDSEQKGESGVLLTEAQAEAIGKFLQEIETDDVTRLMYQ